MNPTTTWTIIDALCSVSLVLGVLAICLDNVPFRRWVRICMCADTRAAHPDGGACSRCGCWQWRPFLVRRHKVREEPEPLPRRRPVPSLPRDGRPLDEYELERLQQVTAALGPPTDSEESRP